MVKVTLEFKSVDEAIVTLGKLVGAPGAMRSAPATQRNTSPAGDSSAAPSAPAAPTTRGRKPRADKGQPREPYGPRTPEPTPTPTGEPIGTAVTDTGKAAEQAGTPPSTPAEATPTYTQAEAQQWLEKVFTTKGMQAAQECLARVGCKRMREVPENLYAKFIDAAKEALA